MGRDAACRPCFGAAVGGTAESGSPQASDLKMGIRFTQVAPTSCGWPLHQAPVTGRETVRALVAYSARRAATHYLQAFFGMPRGASHGPLERLLRPFTKLTTRGRKPQPMVAA